MEEKELPEEELSDEELLAGYDVRSREGGAAAAQAVICILFGAALFVLSRTSPELAGRLLERFRELSGGEAIVPDPIDLLIGLIDKL